MNPTSMYLIVALVCGTLSAILAKNGNRNPYLWFFIGAIGSALSLLLLIFLGKKVKTIIKKW